jgi:DNA repair protein RecN (Recombination protein N)
MLLSISIRSFVLIDQLDLEVGQGFSALTGETGAGKSILLDALGLILGARPNRSLIRKGQDRAVIAASFGLTENDRAIFSLLDAWGIQVDPDEALVVKRIISTTGPSRALINDQAVSSRNLEEIGRFLIEIHGQNASASLFRVTNHRDVLDDFGDLSGKVDRTAIAWRKFRRAREAREGLEHRIQHAADHQDWLAFQLSELADLAPVPGEVTQLEAERRRLLHAGKITEHFRRADRALSAPEMERTLVEASRALEHVARALGGDTDPTGCELMAATQQAADALDRAVIEMEEAAQLVTHLARQHHADPDTLSRIETRLFALRDAARKHRCDVEALAEKQQQLSDELALIGEHGDALRGLKAKESELYELWERAADTLSQARRDAARALERAVCTELAPLHLDRVGFQVQFSPLDPESRGAVGTDRIEFLVETNLGEGFGPLRSIASGGELARFSLALKCALTRIGRARTLIFDEADAGVGGAVAAAIGERLAHLGGDRQVLGVTHSPQVASCARRQLRIRKQDRSGGRVTTEVTQLDDGQRLEEIARMLSGSSISDEARAAASKLLEVA